MKDRIAQAAYVLGCVGAAVFIGWAMLFVVMASQSDIRSDWVGSLAMLSAFALGSYGAGWGLRWIINGTK